MRTELPQIFFALSCTACVREVDKFSYSPHDGGSEARARKGRNTVRAERLDRCRVDPEGDLV